ncbi:unnamed protein product, partial [Closterium sp. NIES-54]
SRAHMKRTPGRGGSDGASQGFSSTAAASAGLGGGSAVGLFNCRDRLRGMGRPQLVLLLVVGTAVIAAHLVVFTAIIRRSLHHCGPAADSPAGWAVGDAREAGTGDSSGRSRFSSSGVSEPAGSGNTAGEISTGGDGGDGAVREGGKSPPRFIMYRIIGNNMPPLQCPSQLLWNTQYALRHEGELEGCEKRWVINQIVNRTERALLIDSLLAHGYSLNHILIRRLNLSKISQYPREQWLDVVTAQNEARNAAIDDGVKAGARWILPLDGNHFITQEAWAAIRRSAEQAESKGYKYFKVPVHRLHAEQKPAWLHANSTFTTIRRYIPQMIESQLAFRSDAPERFKAGMVYGMQNKLELLQRACGVAGEAGYKEQCGCADLGKEGQLHPSDPTIAATCGYSLRLWFFPCNGTEPDKVFNNGLYRKRLRTKSRQTMHAAKAGESKAEDAKGGEVKGEESKAKEVGVGEAKAGETGTDEDTAGDTGTEEDTAGDTGTEEDTAGETRTEEVKLVEIRTEVAEVGMTGVEEAVTGGARTEEANGGETGTEEGAVRGNISKEAEVEETKMQESKKGETVIEEADARAIRTEEDKTGETRTEETGAGVTRKDDATTGEAKMEVDEAREAEGGMTIMGKVEAGEAVRQEVKEETATEKDEAGETENAKPEETKTEEDLVEEINMEESEQREAVEEDSPWDLLDISAEGGPGGNEEINGRAAAGGGAAAAAAKGRSTASPASGASRAMGADLLRAACADLLAHSPQRSLTLRELLPALKSLNRADLAPALAEVIGAAEGRSRGSAHEGRLRSVLSADSLFTIQGMGKSVSVALAAAESDREEGEGAGKRKRKTEREGKRGGKADGEAEVASPGRKRRKGVGEDKGENAEKGAGERKRRKSTGAGKITEDEERKEGAEESKSTSRMCHQCQRNDKETITICSKVHTHRFCGGCIRNWYPYHTPEEIQAICPKCLGVCNCKTCLRTFMPPPFKAESSPEQQRGMARWVLAWVMPHVRAMQKEQQQEVEGEAARQAIDPSSLKVKRAELLKGERIFCSHCQTGIAGLHRSCPECAYDLCLQCCREARSGALPGGPKAFKGMVEQERAQEKEVGDGAQGEKAEETEEAEGKGIGKSRNSSGGKSSSRRSKRGAGKQGNNGEVDDKQEEKQTENQEEKQEEKLTEKQPEKQSDGGADEKGREGVPRHLVERWKVEEDWRVQCPSKDCSSAREARRQSEGQGGQGPWLELRSLHADGWLTQLVAQAEEALGTDGERKSEEIGGTGKGMVKSNGCMDAAAIADAAAAARNAQVALGNVPLVAADQFPCCSLCQQRATQVLQEMSGGGSSSGGSQVAATTTPGGRTGEQDAAAEKEREVGRYYRKRANKAAGKEGEEAKEGQERKAEEKEKGKVEEGKGGNGYGRKEGPPIRGLDFLMRPQLSSSTTVPAAATTATVASTTATTTTTAEPAAVATATAAPLPAVPACDLQHLQQLAESHRLRLASTRSPSSCSSSNFLFCPTAQDLASPPPVAASPAAAGNPPLPIGHNPPAVAHFQQHWQRGEPIIVRLVMPPSVKDGLSWAPLVMWRAFRETKEGRSVQEKLTVVAVDCEDCTEVELGTHQFFECYMNGESKSAKVPDMLKVKDWPPTAVFQDRLPRHGAEFLGALPLHEYTHPEKGLLNLATAVPKGDPKADMGPKAYIAYGVREELVQGDSVTKLHFDMADAVNILTHCHYRPPSKRLQKLMRKNAEGNGAEAGHENGVTTKSEIEKKKEGGNGKGRGGGGGSEQQQQAAGSSGGQVLTAGGEEGAALWDIFRREDSDKIRAFIARHLHEFRHLHNQVIQSMDDEIHDQTVYLTARHKEMLYNEYGVEAWTFEQRRGEAVFIPAGCAHQVRNLMSNMKVAVDFVSPEGTSHCLALTEHVRTMPVHHRSKEDRLEVKRMILHAMERSLSILKQHA